MLYQRSVAPPRCTSLSFGTQALAPRTSWPVRRRVQVASPHCSSPRDGDVSGSGDASTSDDEGTSSPGPAPTPASASSSASASSGAPDVSSSVVPDSMPQTEALDWREFRARLVKKEAAEASQATASASSSQQGTTSCSPASQPPQSAEGEWAHPIPHPEEGCILMAHPLMFANHQTYFHQAIILIVSHDIHGTLGLILNKPSQYTVGNRDELYKAAFIQFADNPLFVGGDVGNGAVMVLHPHGDQLPGAKQIMKGVALGDLGALTKAVERGHLPPESFRFFDNYSGWAYGQLERECQRSVWFTAACSADVVFSGRSGPDMWHHVMQLCGGKLAEASRELLKHEKLGRQGPDQDQTDVGPGDGGMGLG